MTDLAEALEERVREVVRSELAAFERSPRFLSKEALARVLGVPERTVKTWRSKGLPGIQVGRHVMYELAECEKWIEGQG